MSEPTFTPEDASTHTRAILLNEDTAWGNESGAGLMRNRCAFTTRDMGADWPEAFTHAVVLGWEPDAMQSMAAKYGWDDDLVTFLNDAHRRFADLPDLRSRDERTSS